MDLETGINPNLLVFPESHLKSPILTDTLDMVCRGLKLQTDFFPNNNQTILDVPIVVKETIRDHKQTIDSLNNGNFVEIKMYQNLIPYLTSSIPTFLVDHQAELLKILRMEDSIVQEDIKMYQQVLEELFSNTNIEDSPGSNISSLLDFHHIPLDQLESMQPCLERWVVFLDVVTDLKHFQMYKSVVNHQKRSSNRLNWRTYNNWFTIYFSTQIHLFILHKEKRFCVLTTNMLLMLSDMFSQRAQVRLHISLWNSVKARKEQMLTHDQYQFLLNWGDFLLNENDTRAYLVIKTLEPLMLGVLCSKGTSTGRRHNWVMTTLQDVFDMAQDEKITEESYLATMDFLTTVTNNWSKDQVAEAHGLFRLWGHPPLDPVLSIKELQKETTKRKIFKVDTLIEQSAMLRYMLLQSLFRKGGLNWPKITVPRILCPRLYSYKTSGRFPPREEFGNLIQELMLVNFEKIFDVSVMEDLSIYIKDKAIAPPQDMWQTSFNNKMTGSKKRAKTSNRLVEKFINDAEFSRGSFLNYVESGEYKNDPQTNICLSLKEKELSPKGRCFGKLTYKLRGVQTLAEACAANGPASLLDQNGMTKSERELMMTLLKQAETSDGQKMSKDYRIIGGCLTTDIQKYNAQFRAENTYDAGHVFNCMFGLNELFHWLHRALYSKTVYVSNTFTVPDLDYVRTNIDDLDDLKDSNISYSGHPGGIEGFAQKMWTCISISLVELAAWRLNLKVFSLIQGDNQVMIVTKAVPDNTEEELDVMREDLAVAFGQELTRVLGEYGQKLKPYETIIAARMTMYSKMIMHEGIYLPQSLKAVARYGLWSESTADDIRSQVGTTCSLTTRAMSKTFNTSVVMIHHTLMKHFTLVGAITYHVEKNIRESPRILSAMMDQRRNVMLNVGASLGGVNTFNHAKMFTRTIGDPITTSLADLKRLGNVNSMYKEVLGKIINQKTSKMSWRELAQDPFSLNIVGTTSVQTKLANMASSGILTNAKNPILKILYSDYTDDLEESLAKSLLDTDFCIPRAANEIMSRTPVGIKQRISGHVETTKTVTKLVMKLGDEETPLQEILNYQSLYMIHFLNIIESKTSWIIQGRLRQLTADGKGVSYPWNQTCSVTLADNMRSRTWSHLKEGIQIHGSTLPDPLEMIELIQIKPDKQCKTCSSSDSIKIIMTVDPSLKNRQVHRGRRTPYIGSTTTEKAALALCKVEDASQSMKDAIRVATVHLWTFGYNERMISQSLKLANSRAKMSLDSLIALVPVAASGNILHRLADTSSSQSFMTTRQTNFATHVSICNDFLGKWGGDNATDSNIVFQTEMLTGIAMVQDLDSVTISGARQVYHMHVKTDCCLRLIHPLTLPNPNDLPELPPVNSEFTYDEHGDENMSVRNRVRVVKANKKIGDTMRSTTILDEGTDATAEVLFKKIHQALISNNHEDLALARSSMAGGLLSEVLTFGAVEVMTQFTTLLLVQWINDQQYSTLLNQDFQDQIVYYISKLPNSAFSALGVLLLHQGIVKQLVTVGVPYPPPNWESDENNSASNYAVTVITKMLDYVLQNAGIHFGNPRITDFGYKPHVLLLFKYLKAWGATHDTTVVLEFLKIHGKRIKETIIEETSEDDELTISTVKELVKKSVSILIKTRKDTITIEGGVEILTWISKVRWHLYPGNALHWARLALNAARDNQRKRVIMTFDNDRSLAIWIVPPQDQLHFNIPIDIGSTSVPSYNTTVANCQSSRTNPSEFRFRGMYSTAQYKIDSYFYLFSQDNCQGLTNIYLAEGSGMIANSVTLGSNPSRIVFNTLVDKMEIIDQRGTVYNPPNLMKTLTELNIESNLPLTSEQPTDLTDDNTWWNLIKETRSDKIGVLTFDMESKTMSDDTYTSVMSKLQSFIYQQQSIELLLIKTYLHKATHWWNLWSMLKLNCGRVTVSKPFFSDAHNSEVYILAECFSPKRNGSLVADNIHLENLSVYTEIMFTDWIKKQQTDILITSTDEFYKSLGLDYSFSNVIRSTTGCSLDKQKKVTSQLIRHKRLLDIEITKAKSKKSFHYDIFAGSEEGRSMVLVEDYFWTDHLLDSDSFFEGEEYVTARLAKFLNKEKITITKGLLKQLLKFIMRTFKNKAIQKGLKRAKKAISIEK